MSGYARLIGEIYHMHYKEHRIDLLSMVCVNMLARHHCLVVCLEREAITNNLQLCACEMLQIVNCLLV